MQLEPSAEWEKNLRTNPLQLLRKTENHRFVVRWGYRLLCSLPLCPVCYQLEQYFWVIARGLSAKKKQLEGLDHLIYRKNLLWTTPEANGDCIEFSTHQQQPLTNILSWRVVVGWWVGSHGSTFRSPAGTHVGSRGGIETLKLAMIKTFLTWKG